MPGLASMLQGADSEEASLAAAWALGHVGKHSPQHSLAVAVANVFPTLMQVLLLGLVRVRVYLLKC